ncbi:Ig domain-containing protein [Aromatoleum anaerobium]|uniref:Ig domain-containing protein n=1 Tax=Aromatoleum anaerobium TaxID=182180 RepID=UPI001FF4E6A8|nr:Ig domain-containing protein [Aromatoleum anaerobium]MCK0507245.1 Ig domain-containing protein [Aromatoleum anaerobium]
MARDIQGSGARRHGVAAGCVWWRRRWGGGGGGAGNVTPTNEYQISLRADHTSLPLNIAGVGPGIGVDAPYTTTLYVSARRAGTNDPIPGGENIFSCNVVPQGLEQGALYYLDGDPDHETEVDIDGTTIKVPKAFRSVTLGSNAGAASFHFHAGNTAGTATITCAVTDPQSNKDVTTQLQINVGQATGKASQIRVNRSAPGFLFAQNTNGTTQLIVQAQVLDEAGQRVPNPTAGTHNLYASIVETPGLADNDALLRAGGASGKWVLSSSTNGQAQFTLVSGVATGSLLVEIMTDRFDNNVDNGITEPVRNLFTVPVVLSVGQEALAVSTATDLPSAEEEKSYATILTATGGVPPYKWERVSGSTLPGGLTLSSDGVITGTPFVDGTFRFALKVTDSATLPQTAMKEFSITITPAPVPEPVVTAPQVVTSALPAGTANQSYLALLAASGGKTPYTWSAMSTPFAGGLTVTADGVISGTTGTAETYPVAFTVKDADGLVASRMISITISN